MKLRVAIKVIWQHPHFLWDCRYEKHLGNHRRSTVLKALKICRRNQEHPKRTVPYLLDDKELDERDPCEVVYDGVPISEVGEINLLPRGGTPLLDAVLKSTAHVDKRLNGVDANVLFMIITDGGENESREAKKPQVQARIKELEARGWVFLYLGANVDAFSEAALIGANVVRAAAYNATPLSVAALYDDVGGKAWRARTASAKGASLCASDFEYSDADRQQIATGNIQCSASESAKAEFSSTPQSQTGEKS